MVDPNSIKDGDKVKYVDSDQVYTIRLWKDENGFVKQYQFLFYEEGDPTPHHRVWVFNDFSWSKVTRVK